MSSIVLDGFGEAGPWSAHAPDGSASSLLSVSAVAGVLPDGYSAASRLQVRAQRGSARHYAERLLAAAVDLSKFQVLRLWVNGDTVTNGHAPFYVRIRLASAAVPFGSGGNTWSRLIPVPVADTWQLVELDLGDLPAAIGSAVTATRLESADNNTGFRMIFDSLLAVTPQMLPDIESALQAALDKRVTLTGGAVAAVVSQPGTALPAGASIRISPALVEYMPEISTSEDRKSDFTDTGFVMRPPLRGYCIYYDVDAQGPQAGDRSTMLEFVLGAIGAGRPLLVNGEYLPIEHVAIPWPTTPPPFWLPLRFRVKAWKAMATPSQTVKPVLDVVVNAEEAPA